MTPLEGIKRAVKPGTEVVFVKGCDLSLGKFFPIPSKYLRTPDGKEGLRGEYFANRNLEGKPVLVRVDREVNFDWGLGSPDPKLPPDNFSVRWTGKLVPPETRVYEIYARTDDGVRLWIDGKLLIDSWHDRGATTDRARVRLEAGKEHEIRIEYYEHAGVATAQIGWDYEEELPSGIGEAVEAAREVGFPVVLKVVSPDVLHKSDVGGVRVNLKTEEEVREAFRSIMESVRERVPNARIAGILVQEFAPPGLELIIGLIRDPQFGPTVMFGLGGVFVEVYRDVSFRVAPLSEHDADSMMREIKAYKLLTGFRGMEPVDLEALRDALIKVGQIGLEHEDIAEMDLNPVIAYPRGLKVVDARIILR